MFIFIFYILLFVLATPVEAAGANQTQVMKTVVAGGLDEWVTGAATGMIEDSPVTARNGTGSVNVFSPIVQPATILDNAGYEAEMEANKAIAFDVARLCLLLIVLYVLIQEWNPKKAYELSRFVNGRPTYYFPSDILKFAVYTGGWFVGGVAILYFMVYHNNDLVSGMDTGVLDQVIVSSENLSNYFTLGVCVKGLKIYFSMRESILVYAMKNWYFLGAILFFKYSRWVGVLFLQYIAIQVYIQALIVSILVTSVKHVLATSPNGSDMLHFASTSLLLAVIVGVAFTAPIWIRLLSPSTWQLILNTARRV